MFNDIISTGDTDIKQDFKIINSDLQIKVDENQVGLFDRRRSVELGNVLPTRR